MALSGFRRGQLSPLTGQSLLMTAVARNFGEALLARAGGAFAHSCHP
jgi:hypothetical protein